jgi:hypothetical protein
MLPSKSFAVVVLEITGFRLQLLGQLSDLRPTDPSFQALPHFALSLALSVLAALSLALSVLSALARSR